jgi:hypothetical protein
VPLVVPVVPVPVDVLLLVVPEAVPPVVREGMPPDSVGMPPGSAGTDPENVGTLPGSAGTAGTVGPLLVGAVITVVTPDVVVGGITTVPADAPLGATGVVLGVVAVVLDDVPPTPVTTRGGAPSGSTQFTSRFEQKSGIDVRSVESAASAGDDRAVATAIASRVRAFMKPPSAAEIAGRCKRWADFRLHPDSPAPAVILALPRASVSIRARAEAG